MTCSPTLRKEGVCGLRGTLPRRSRVGVFLMLRGRIRALASKVAWTSAVEAVDPVRSTTPVLRVVGWRNVNCKMDGGCCGSVYSVYFQRVTQSSAECGRSSELRKSLNFGVVDGIGES